MFLFFQSSQSHEFYLKKWSIDWDVPIFSIDYSLAPEAPYPRALEETIYAYCWMIQNLSLLGSNGSRIILGGNSAGANLAVGLVRFCIENSLPKPDTIFLAYPSLLCRMFPSPSRLLTLLDPLVVFPYLLRCLNAYSDPCYSDTLPRSFAQELEASLALQMNTDPYLSPLLTSEEILAQFPATVLLVSDMDPCLDETVAFCNRLIRAGVTEVELEVIEGLPHGFFSYSGMSIECHEALDEATKRLQAFLGLNI